jgi:hypothetical protein
MDGDPNVVMFGLMSSMRTGNMLVDMAVCLILPFIFKSLWAQVHVQYTRLTRWLRRKMNRQYKRTIEFQRSNRPWEQTKASHKNRVLIQAVRMYIGRQVKPHYPVGDMKLQTVKSAKEDSSVAKTLVDQLEKKYHIHCVPPKNGEPVEVAPGLYFQDRERVNRSDDEEGKKTKAMTMVTTLTFTTYVSGGRKRVDDFLEKAYAWYVDQVEAAEDHSYFMYQPLVSSSSSSGDGDKKEKSTQYKRYLLSGEKTFNSIFFPEREKVLNILGHFDDRSGKFAIKGFPHKLGLLLHGPPGTGKTSLVKAIAAHTKRHIISVPLSRIRTNQELMDVMFDQVFPHKSGGGGGGDDDDSDGGGGAGETTKHKISEVVFLLEDVDAASKVVHSRGDGDGSLPSPGKKSGKKKNKEDDVEESTMTRELSVAISRNFTQKDGSDDDDDKDEDGEADGSALKKSKSKAGDDDAEGDDGEKKDGDAKGKKKKKGGLWEDADKLDLAGLLNVLDGVVDAPGRILVMTTNHPEKLDKALLRPGRVNMRIYMGFICCNDAMRMTNHYYPGSTEKDLAPVRAAFERKERACKHGLKMSPAEFEQLCAESSALTDLVRAVDAYVPKRR